MPMTKKEQAYVSELENTVRISRSFKFTPAVKPDVYPPVGGGELSKGFSFNSHSWEVCPACSSSVSHNCWADDKTTSQGARNLFSSRKLALQAMRHELEIQYAGELAKIDKLVEAEG